MLKFHVLQHFFSRLRLKISEGWSTDIDLHSPTRNDSVWARFEDMSRNRRWTFKNSLKSTLESKWGQFSALIHLKILIYAVKTSFHAALGERKFFEHFFVPNSVLGTPCGWNGFPNEVRIQEDQKKWSMACFSVSLKTQFLTVQIDEKLVGPLHSLEAKVRKHSQLQETKFWGSKLAFRGLLFALFCHFFQRFWFGVSLTHLMLFCRKKVKLAAPPSSSVGGEGAQALSFSTLQILTVVINIPRLMRNLGNQGWIQNSVSSFHPKQTDADLKRHR